MISEIRVYHESIEQGAHFILPLLEKHIKNIKNKPEIKLIKLKQNFIYYSKRIAPIIFWKNPDILLTVVKDNQEYPIFMIEFSTAVFTEDHELQRFDGILSSIENNCIYIKISPNNKESQSQHGGNTDFDYIGPFSLIYKNYNRMSYHFEWKCDEIGIVSVDDIYMSCPEQITELEKFIEILLRYLCQNEWDSDSWIDVFEKNIINEDYFKLWKEKLENYKSISIEALKSTRLDWNTKTSELSLKLNRFGHAMDPERGMLAYYGTLCNNLASKMLFDSKKETWFKATPKESEIRRYLKEKGLKNNFDYLYCFMLGSGLYNVKDFLGLMNNNKDNKEDIITIDLTSFINNNYSKLSKPMRAIFKYSKYFYLVDTYNKTKVRFNWSLIKDKEDFSKYPDITPIKKGETYSEDEVTYIMVHNVLKDNNFKILAVSYPGAQGDRAVLVQPGTGRTQERKYIDIISYLPNKFSLLQENKPAFSSSIQGDIDKLLKYKETKDHITAINTFFDRFDINAPRKIKIGIGFLANKNFSISNLQKIELDKLDYFVYILHDKSKWRIWTSGNNEMFNLTEGKIKLPFYYEVKS